MQPRRPARAQPVGDFEGFQASEIFCPRCRAAQPVRERLLLVLPDGDLYEYLCTRCGGSVGSRKVTGPPEAVFLR
jgi:hypothetical protein